MQSARPVDATYFSDGLRKLNEASKAFARALSATTQFIRNTITASHHVLGQYTSPIESEIFQHQNPVTLSSLNKVGVGTLIFPLPVVPVTMILSVTVTPLIYNSYQSFVRTFLDVINLPLFGMPNEKHKKAGLIGIATENDDRHWLRRMYGAPGFLLGGLLASPIASIIFASRVLADTIETSVRTFVSISNLASLGRTKWPFGLENDDRGFIRQCLMGGPGLLIGAAIGTIATPFFLLRRLAEENINTAKRAIFSCLKIACYPDRFDAEGLEQNDHRHLLIKYGISAPGLLAGLGLGVAVSALTIFGRVLFESFETTGHAYFSVLNPLAKPEHLGDGLEENDNRHFLRKYGLGLPGLVFGLGLGTIISPFFLVSRIIEESWQTAKRTFCSIVNPFLRTRSLGQGLEENDSRYFAQKYVLGGLGFFGGAISGVMAVVGLGVARFFRETAHSWQALSGSFMNGAINMPAFNGIRSDNRHPMAKAVGGFGYVASLVTTLPVAVSVFSFRMASLVVSGLACVAASPFVLAAKGYARIFKKPPNFAYDPHKSEVEQKLNRLKSSLNWRGYLKPNTPIVQEGDGKESIGIFLRKAMTGNRKTVTEKILDTFVKQNREDVPIFSSTQSDEDDVSTSRAYHREYDDEIRLDMINREGESTTPENNHHILAERVRSRVNHHYKNRCSNTFCFPSAKHTQDIDKIVNFVEDYLDTDASADPMVVDPKIYTKRSWFSLFRGKPSRHHHEVKQDEEVSLALLKRD